ncbi:MAG: DUF262 domain-containing protein [Actinobacteria bacterium]|nr:MAG: DUF262 domain-containing protein [Actinomycetota bacterium]
MTADGYRKTTFLGLTKECESGEALAVQRVEIPLFQRDYAQGRENDSVERIRSDFLDVLFSAIDDKQSVGLDFVYGGVSDGTLRPLDGQQRLTTLFLLHWYIASRAGVLNPADGWTGFTYATRQSARMFCESLIAHPLEGKGSPSAWIKDRPWYLFLWRHDPTIQSMLVVLDAIDERFRETDAAAAWARLNDADNPAVWFLLLPLSGLGTVSGEEMRPEDLYIKMNSRGKPLTEFENFKAHFEQTIQWSPRSSDFALNVDTRWSDLLWHLRGDDDLIDDEFLRYLEFVTEICEWRDGRIDGAGQRLDRRTEAIFGQECPEHGAHLDFLFEAFDAWCRHPAPDVFARLFGSDRPTEANSPRTRLFFRGADESGDSANLLEACCRSYGESRARTRVFSLGQSLVLYAVLLHLTEGTPDFPRRVRILRNLIEASSDQLRPQRMPAILDDVHRVIRDGAVEMVATLNQAQVDDEKHKAEFLAKHRQLQDALYALEDHRLLRGSLGAFELDATVFEARARAFELLLSQPQSWTDLLASLLASGEYQRQRTNSRPFLFGTNSSKHEGAWRELLTGPTRETLTQTRIVFGRLLDAVASTTTDPVQTMRSITADYLAQCEAEERFDWRYYMVKYPSMRESGSSTYYTERDAKSGELTMGYSVCMMRAGVNGLNSNYRDPYLLAIVRELEDPSVVEDKWFTGYEDAPRRLPLVRSGASIRCVADGFELRVPELESFTGAFEAACATLGCDENNRIRLAQVEVDGRNMDAVDRVRAGAEIVTRLAEAGL